MITDNYQALVKQLDEFYTNEGTPSDSWKEKPEEQWRAYNQLMDNWEEATVKLYETAQTLVEGRPLYEWRVAYEILQFKKSLLDQVGGVLFAQEAPIVQEEILKIERIFEALNKETENEKTETN